MKQYPVHYQELPNGERLAYRVAGTGPTVVLIHGNMSAGLHWQTTMAALEDDFTVYAPDLRGCGDSTYHARFDSLLELARDLEAWLDGLGIEQCALVGWSTGGGVALELAADRPGQVQALVLVDSVPPTGYPVFAKDETGQPILTRLIATKAELAQDPVQVLPVEAAYACGDREFLRLVWNATIYHLHQPPAEDYELYLDAILKQRNLVDIIWSLLRFNMTDAATGSAPGSGRLAGVLGPVSVLHGEQDLVVPLAWGQGTAAALGDRARLVTFPGAGHCPITDVPEEFFAALRRALG